MTEKKIRILVADDEWSAREVIQNILLNEGFEVQTAEDGKQAIEHLDADRFDIAITDLKMPNADGIEVLRHIQNRHLDTIGIIATYILNLFRILITIFKSINAGHSQIDILVSGIYFPSLFVFFHCLCKIAICSKIVPLTYYILSTLNILLASPAYKHPTSYSNSNRNKQNCGNY